jgi:hypothetical protein
MDPVTRFRARSLQWLASAPIRYQRGRMGYILLWLLGVPIPILLLIYLLKGCT